MRVLITGAAGGVGQAAVEWGLNSGVAVSAISRDSYVLAEQAHRGARTYLADLNTLSEKFLWREMLGCDAVWHCAGLVSPHALEMEYEESNVRMAARMFEAAAEVSVPVFVHISSPSLYFNFAHNQRIPETFKSKAFASLYAASKARAEDVLLALAQKHPNTRLVILRPRLLYGKYDQVFIPTVERLLKKSNGKLWLPKDGYTMMDLCSHDNLINAMVLASTVPVPSGSIYNITDGTPLTLKELMLALASPMGHTLKITTVPYPLISLAARGCEAWARWFGGEPWITRHVAAGLNYHFTLDISKAREELGYTSLCPTQQGIHLVMQQRLGIPQ